MRRTFEAVSTLLERRDSSVAERGKGTDNEDVEELHLAWVKCNCLRN